MNEQTINDALALQRQSTTILVAQIQEGFKQIQTLMERVKELEASLQSMHHEELPESGK
jgi:hypothetical protein